MGFNHCLYSPLPPESESESLAGDVGGDDKLSQMLNTLMGEASQVRGSGASSTS